MDMKRISRDIVVDWDETNTWCRLVDSRYGGGKSFNTLQLNREEMVNLYMVLGDILSGNE